MSDEKNTTIETLLRVWDGFAFDNGDVFRDSVRALLDAAYSGGWIDAKESPAIGANNGSYSMSITAIRETGLQSPGAPTKP